MDIKNLKSLSLDDLTLNGHILLSVKEINDINGCGIAQAKEMFRKRYYQLRAENPLGFKLNEDEYFRDLNE